MSITRYTCRVRGNALAPRFEHNEWILVDPEHEPARGDEVLIVLNNGLRLVRELVARGTGAVTVRPIGGQLAAETLNADVIERVDYICGSAGHYILGFAHGPEVRV
jgi:hypothetical protein